MVLRFLENLCTLVRGDMCMPVSKSNDVICQGIYMYVYTHTQRVFKEECTRHWENIP